MVSRRRLRQFATALLVWGAQTGCGTGPDRNVGAQPDRQTPEMEASRPAPEPEPDPDLARRVEMVRSHLEARNIRDAAVLTAMRKVPREKFVLPEHARYAYRDGALPIGHGVTISQPYIVALMSQLLEVGPGDRVLEVGTGSGYQAAVLAEMGVNVYSIEIIEPLAAEARARLAALGYGQVKVRAGDGYAGWPAQAPFAGIVVTAAPPEVPEPLKQQLAVGGKLVIPVGTGVQQLRVITRAERGYSTRDVIPVRFVPMTGEAQRR